MPNDCWNSITFISEDNSEELTDLFNKEIKATNPPENCLQIDYKGKNGIKFKLWSAWGGDSKWLEGLIPKYPNCWIKNDWYEEGGGAGIFIGGFLNGKKQETIIKEWDEIPIEGIAQYFGGGSLDVGSAAVSDRYGFK
jgi:hypothetical protein